MKDTNEGWFVKLSKLSELLSYSGVVGYAAAKNTREIGQDLVEYESIREELIKKYGTQEVGEDGKETGRYYLEPNTTSMINFVKEISDISNIEQEIEIVTIPADKASETLTGEQMLKFEWMLEWGEE